MPRVKAARRYDSRGRLAQADRNRKSILDAARLEFDKRGYAPTTVAAIAKRAKVSVETVYKRSAASRVSCARCMSSASPGTARFPRQCGRTR